MTIHLFIFSEEEVILEEGFQFGILRQPNLEEKQIVEVIEEAENCDPTDVQDPFSLNPACPHYFIGDRHDAVPGKTSAVDPSGVVNSENENQKTAEAAAGFDGSAPLCLYQAVSSTPKGGPPTTLGAKIRSDGRAPDDENEPVEMASDSDE